MSDTVVIVYPTVMDGTVVRWYRSAKAAEYGTEMASASRNGVCVEMAPRAIAMAAYDVYDTLKANSRADVSGLATHRRTFKGPAVPVDPRTP